MGRFAGGGKLGLVGKGPVFFGIEEDYLKYFGVIGVLLDYVLSNELHLGAKFDAQVASQFVDLVCTVVAVAAVVAILEAEAVLGGFYE